MNTQQLETLLRDLDIIKDNPIDNGSVLLHGSGSKSESVIDYCFNGGVTQIPFIFNTFNSYAKQ